MVELALRLVVSLAAVVGLLLLIARFSQRKFGGGDDALVRVVHRRPLSRTASVAVVTVGERVLVLGTTDQQVSVLAELEPDEVATALSAASPADDKTPLDPAADMTSGGLSIVTPGRHRADVPSRARAVVTEPAAPGALTGSVLSPQTWRQALAAATRARNAS